MMYDQIREDGTVGKLSLAGTSLLAAIPGAMLTFIMLRAVLGAINNMPTPLMVASLVLLVVAAAMALFPAYLLIWYRSGGGAATAAAPRKSKGDAEATGAMAAGAVHDDESEVSDEMMETFEPEDDLLGEYETSDEIAADDSFEDEDVDFDDEFSGEMAEVEEEFEFDEFEDDEDDRR